MSATLQSGAAGAIGTASRHAKSQETEQRGLAQWQDERWQCYHEPITTVAFDTLRLAQRLEAAGLSAREAQDMATALSDTIGETVVNRESSTCDWQN